MRQVSVIGLGHWGTALANHCASKGLSVCGWSRELSVVESINSQHRNSGYLSEVVLHESLVATHSLEEALSAEFVVLALPARVLPEVIPLLRMGEEQIVVSAIKGLEPKSAMTPLSFAAAHLPQKNPLSVLSGPSFAKDIVARRPAGVVAASADEGVARKVAELFTSDCLKVYISTDPLGVELGGILKNVIALAAGVCDGLQYGDSARAGLITRGLAEMMRLAGAMGADIRTLSGLSGLGDLVMTSTVDLSRNRTVGLRLGRGEKLDHIVKTLGSVAEGVWTTPLAVKLAEKYEIDMPITLGVQKLLNGEATPQEMAKMLLSRPPRREF